MSDDKNGGPHYLREVRTNLGLSQADLAKAVGTSANMIHYLESGERALTLKWIRRIAVALNVSPLHLIDAQPSITLNTPEDRPIYRLLTGKDDRAFCERVSEALEQGWRLYGSPTLAWDQESGCMKAAQAVVWHEADVVK